MKFTKMHGLGNDFMVINAISQKVNLSEKEIIRLGRRDIGVGFDQCLLVEKSEQTGVDFFYRIYNADGSEVGQCGNGARCLARFIQAQQLSNKRRLCVATQTTKMELQLEENGKVSVFFVPPEFLPEHIPLEVSEQAERYRLALGNGETCWIHALSVGNPHAVIKVDNVETAEVSATGVRVSQHPAFPQQCNAGFMQILSHNEMRLRVYERGCGETRACGSGAVAAAVVGRRFYGMEPDITVHLLGGDLQIGWQGLGHAIRMTGPAEFVYHGELV